MRALLFLLCVYASTEGSSIDVVPADDQFIAVNSPDNVTFTCDVRGPEGTSTNREAEWEVQQRQIQNDENNSINMLFASLGILLEIVEQGVTGVTVTSMARQFYLNESPPNPNITVRCNSFAFADGEVGQEFTITTFESPSIPLELSLNPDPNDVTELVFSWVVPEGSLAGVPLTYSLAITGLSLDINDTTMDTSFTFRDDASRDCQPHMFSLFASNAAGDGPVASINETIPITPNITAIDAGFDITQVSLVDTITITISVPLAESCNQGFPILGYFLSIVPVFERRQLNFREGQDGNPFIRNLPLPELEMNGVFQVFIDVCISITCRQSESRTLRTTDVQTAMISFFENNIFMSCTFASNSDARGCLFELILFDQNGVETFFLSQSSSDVSQCNQTLNQRSAYESIIVSDVEADGTIGTLPIVLDPTPLEDSNTYTSLTGCTIPGPGSSLSAGAIAGIVIAALIIAAAVLCVVIVVLVYRVRTGHWFKLREKDADKLTMHFEKELLMGDEKPRRKLRIGASTSTRPGHGSADHSTAIDLVDSAIPPKSRVEADSVVPLTSVVEEQDAAVATNPNSAFTLDISSDRKTVKLHLNKALIRRVLQDKKLNTMDRKKPHRQVSVCKQHLLPLHCEVRVEVEDEQS